MLRNSGSALHRLLLLGLTLGLTTRALCATQAGSDFKYGADVSALPAFEKLGAVYRDAQGNAGDALEILTEEGVNLYRLRLFVNPRGKRFVVNDLPYTLALAKRVKAAGAELLLDFHYSDTWADPGRQKTPVAWEGLGLEALAEKVKDYSFSVIQSFVEAGITPDFIQTGNEINGGMLHPVGALWGGKPRGEARWASLAPLLKAGIRGCKAALPETAPTRFILHVAGLRTEAQTRWWYRSAMEHGVEFDIIGLSYYAHWHGDLGQLKRTLEGLDREFDQDIMIVETAYPFKMTKKWREKDYLHWPVTPGGQAQFLGEVISLVRNLPNGKGIGICYWHPESILLGGQKIWQTGSCALFDETGRVLPAVNAFHPSGPIPLTLPSDFHAPLSAAE